MSITQSRSWVRTQLAEIVRVVRGRVSPQDHSQLPFIGMDSVEAQTMRLLGTVSASTMKSAAVHFRPGDVLYGRLRPYLNKVVAPGFEGLASAEFIPLTPPEGVDPKFVQYRINASDFVSYASRLDEGERPRVDYDQIGAFKLDVPSTAEQRRIVEAIESYFTRLDDAVATLERVLRNVKRYRASVLHAAVEGRLVPTEAELARAEGRSYEPASVLLERILAERRLRWEETELAKMNVKGKVPKDDRWKAKYVEPVAPDTTELPNLPEGWCWASMSALTVWGPQNGIYVPRSKYGHGTPILRIDDYQVDWSRSAGDLQRIDISIEDAQRYALSAGDIVINRVNSPSHLGKTLAVLERHLPAVFESNMMRFRLSKAVVPSFIHGYLSSTVGKTRLTANAKWAVNQASINQDDVGMTAVPLAPEVEQRRIVSALERHLSSAQQAASSTLTSEGRCLRLRQSILRWAFAGRLVDQDPSDEPASVLLERIRAESASVGGATPARRRSGKAQRRSQDAEAGDKGGVARAR